MPSPFLSTGDIPTAADWNALPRGFLAMTVRTADLASIGSGIVDLGTIAATVNLVAGRRIRVTGYTILRSGTAAATAGLLIREGTTTLVETTSNIHLASGGAQAPWHASVILSPSSGSHTYKLSSNFNANTNNELRASATNPTYILVEDLGAV